MMHTDWNGNGKHDMADGYMDYKLSSGASHTPHGSSGPRRVPTWLLVIVLVGIVSGDLPINPLTVLLAAVMAVVIWIRLIS